MLGYSMPILDRIVKGEDPEGCWLWLTKWGTPSRENPRISKEECGSLIATKDNILVVRVLYFLLRERGVRAPSLFPSMCGNPLCVNPYHRAATPAERFWRKVDKQGDDDCWNWTGGNTGRGIGYGHGRFSMHGKPMHATHFMLKYIENTDIPSGMVVLHSCDNPSCVNPKHLSVGTQSANIKDCYARNRKERLKVGAKLTEENVIFILANRGILKVLDLANTFGVTEKTIYRIYSGTTWRHIKR